MKASIALLVGLLGIAALPTAAASGPVTVSTDPLCVGVDPGEDVGSTFCADPTDPECIVRETRETIAGPMEFCWVPAP